MSIALIGAVGIIVGVLISEVRRWIDMRQRFKVMTFERRLVAHQEALSQIYRILRDVHGSSLNNNQKLDSIKKAETWWEDNQLLLDEASRRQMQELFVAAYEHIEQSDQPSAFRRVWRKTHETIYKGIGTKHLPDTRYKEEEDKTSKDSNVIEDKVSVPIERAWRAVTRMALNILLKSGLWTLALNLLVFLVLAISYFDIAFPAQILKAFLPFSVLIFIGIAVYYFIKIWALETGYYTMLVFTVFFLLASGANLSISNKLYEWFNGMFRIDYFGVGLAAAGIAAAIIGIREEHKKQSQN